MKIQSREYKLMLRVEKVYDEATVNKFWSSLDVAKGKMKLAKSRSVCFLDSDVRLIRSSGMVLRRREGNDTVSYTLKLRSPDRFIAETKWKTKPKGREKFEEDISFPFQPRYSHSCTIDYKRKHEPKLETFGDLGKVFRNFKMHDDAKLEVVNDVVVNEQVFDGIIKLETQEIKAGIAIWHDTESNPVVAEFSFKYEQPYRNHLLAHWCKSFFEDMQNADECDPIGVTKTQWAYSEMSWIEQTVTEAQMRGFNAIAY